MDRHGRRKWTERRLPSVLLSPPKVRVTALLSLVLLALPLQGQTATTQESASGTCAAAELKQGVVVESVAKNSEGEKAGLAEGDIILSWSRGEAKGPIESPFDLSEIETEQEPRGRVTLEGTRGGVTQTWMIGPDKWRIQARPSLPENLLVIYREGQELAKAAKLTDAAARWRAAAEEGQKYQCSWLRSWFLFYAAEVLADSQQWKESDVLYQEAMQRPGTGLEITAQLSQGLARVFERRGDLAEAEVRFRQSLAIREKLAPDGLDVAESLNNLGNVADERGDLAEAEECYRRALEIRRKLAPGSLAMAASVNNLGNVADERGDLAKAEEYYGQALEIRRERAPGGLAVGASLNNLGVVAWKRGDLTKAEEYHRQALMIKEKLAADILGVAASLANLGLVALDRGDLDKAEEYYRRALAIRTKLAPGSLGVASDLGNLGEVARYRGDFAKAEEYYQRALAIDEKLAPGSLDVAAELIDLGELADARGDFAKAEECFHQALAIDQKLAPGSLAVAIDLNNLGAVARNRGDLAKAEEYFHQSLAIDDKLAPGSLALAWDFSGLGSIASHRGNLGKSEDYYRQALEIRKKLAPGKADYADSLAALAGIMRDKQETEEAARLYAQAIDVLDGQLAHLGGSSEARAGFRAKHADYYSDYADLLLEQKEPELAFQVLERSRARTLLETLAEARVDIRQGADLSLLERERTLQVTLTAKSNRKISLLEGEHTEEQVAAFGKEIDALLSQYQEVEGQIRATSPSYAALTQPQPLGAKEVQQQLLDAATVLLEYALGEKRSFVFVVTPTSLGSYELPKRSEIEESARRAYDLLTSRNRWIEGETSAQRRERLAKGVADYQLAAASLSHMILGPIAARLEGKRLLIVADGALQYVPFAVLPASGGDPSKPAVPLVAEHEIVNLPSASVLALLRRQANGRSAGPKEVAVLADPVFDKDDPRVGKTTKNKQLTEPASAKETIRSVPEPSLPEPSHREELTRSLEDVGMGTRQAGSTLPRLAFSRKEADSILAMTDPGKGMEALDFQASRETALSKDLSQYRVVHFATHGLLDNEHPELSGLVLSLVDQEGKPRDGFLNLEDVYNLTLPTDLVVLSACETGLGKQITGEGLVGLTRGFMYAGATRVVASLWKVDDVATAELMGRFYRGMLKEGLRPAAALRQAQMEMQKQKRWSDPYYWAAFTIQGEWK
jgi:CHAT domain-containing protein/Tfp pilus assembly protein PilF